MLFLFEHGSAEGGSEVPCKINESGEFFISAVDSRDVRVNNESRQQSEAWTRGARVCGGICIELLCEAITQFDNVTESTQDNFSPRELRCLIAARDLLARQFAPPPTIRQVARSAGMAETTLKRDFKAAFGETIFDFSIRCRMQHALKLLRTACVPIVDVGQAVGYRHQAAFATAFRRHFGMRPKEVRRPRR